MAIDWSLLKFGKGKPRIVTAHEKTTALDAALRKAYEKVDKRDGKVCQVTGRPLTANHPDLKLALERHHLDERSGHKDRVADADNILTCSTFAHKYLQSGALLPVDKRGKDTTSVKKIAGYKWNPRLVKRPPFRVQKQVAA